MVLGKVKLSGNSLFSAEYITLVSSAQQLRSVRPSWRAFYAAELATLVKMATFNSTEHDQTTVQFSSNGAEPNHNYQGKHKFLN